MLAYVSVCANELFVTVSVCAHALTRRFLCSLTESKRLCRSEAGSRAAKQKYPRGASVLGGHVNSRGINQLEASCAKLQGRLGPGPRRGGSQHRARPRSRLVVCDCVAGPVEASSRKLALVIVVDSVH